MYPHKRKVNTCFVDISVCADLIIVGLAPATSLQQIIKGIYLTGTNGKAREILAKFILYKSPDL